MTSHDQGEFEKMMASLAQAKASSEQRVTEDDLLKNAHERFGDLWKALDQYHRAVVESVGSGAAVNYDLGKVDLKNAMLLGSITLTKQGGLPKKYPFEIQGRGIWISAFPQLINGKSVTMYNQSELPGLLQKIRHDMAKYFAE